MQFGTLRTREAEGAILAHGLRAAGQLFKKGRLLSAADIAALVAAGVTDVMAARLEAGDVDEDSAAAAIAAAAAGAGVRVGAPFTGRANLYAEAAGLALIDAGIVHAVNAIGEAITLATAAPFASVGARQMLATAKIIPFAAPKAELARAQSLLAGRGAVALAPFRPHDVALISTTLPGTDPALLEKNRRALGARLAALGSRIAHDTRVAHDEAGLAHAIVLAHAEGCDPILIFGASAITDRRDVIPAAIARAGGTVQRFGVPVDPGNLLLLGELHGVAVVGLPGCARSPKLNGADFVLQRLMAGLKIVPQDLGGMGVGGLLSEIALRPQPREEPPAMPHAPRIGAVVLAAGQSTRMGSNKLLAEIEGTPLIRRVAEAALASHCEGVTVVTGHRAEAVEQALTGLPLRCVHNPDYAEGIASSLRCGIAALDENTDGALVLLGDMPGVDAGLIDRLIAAFAPADGRAICVPSFAGKRGNPVLWARRFFAEMAQLGGDTGARALISANDELVAEVATGDDAPLVDVDTPEALEAWRAR